MVNIDDELKVFASATGLTLEEVRREFEAIRSDPFVNTDPQFPDDYSRDLYALQATKVRLTSRPRTEEHICVPVGFSGFRYSKSGETYSEVYALFPELDRDGPVIRRIQIAKNADPSVYKTLSFDPPHAYHVTLSRLQGGDFRAADKSCIWKNPQPIRRQDGTTIDPLDFVRRIKICDVPSNVAQKRGGFIDTCDWRCVEGIVTRVGPGTRDDGLPYTVIDIGDGSVVAPMQIDDTRTLRPTLTVWLPEELRPDVDDLVRVYGTINMSQSGFSIQAYFLRIIIKSRGGMQ